MAVEMHVIFRGKLPNKRELSRAMGDLGFPLTIVAGSLEKQRGFMPMKMRGEETGVEFDVFEGRAAVEEIGGSDVDPRFDRSANFRWGGDEDEMLAGTCAAAGLAELVDGVIFDAEAGKPAVGRGGDLARARDSAYDAETRRCATTRESSLRHQAISEAAAEAAP